jgi:hypothetical protein
MRVKLHNRLQYSVLVIGLLLGVLLVPIHSGATQDDQEVSASVKFDTFKLILERNLFDPNRKKKVEIPPVLEEVRKPQVDTINLVGTLITETASYAFFNSSISEYNSVLVKGDRIAGYIITAIDSISIQLVMNNQSISLKVGMSMVREDDGSWELRTEPIRDLSVVVKSDQQTSDTSSSSSETESTSEAGDSSANDILKKLIERRNQEMGK